MSDQPFLQQLMQLHQPLTRRERHLWLPASSSTTSIAASPTTSLDKRLGRRCYISRHERHSRAIFRLSTGYLQAISRHERHSRLSSGYLQATALSSGYLSPREALQAIWERWALMKAAEVVGLLRSVNLRREVPSHAARTPAAVGWCATDRHRGSGRACSPR